MACVALTSLIETIEIEFLEPIPRVRLSLHVHDRPPIIYFLANLSSLQAFLQEKKKSSRDGDGALRFRELEIQIKDFALKAEDDIEVQLNNILLSEDTEYREKASHELHQTLREAAKNSTELLKIITTEKEYCESETEMAIVALTILMTKFKFYFWQPFPTVVYLGDDEEMMSFLQNLSSLKAFVHNGGAPIKNLETQIRNFALKVEDDIEIQLRNFLLAKDTEHEKEASQSQELCQTLQEAAKIAAELLKIINKETEHERERKMICDDLTSLRETIEESVRDVAGTLSDFLEKLSCLQVFLREESSGGEDLKTKTLDFAIQLFNYFKAKETVSQPVASMGKLEASEVFLEAKSLLGIITKEKEYHESVRKIASDDLKTFMKTFHYDFLHRFPIVRLDDKATTISFFEKLSSCQDYLLQKESSGGVAINGLGTKIIYFVLKAKDDIEAQIKIVIQAKDDTEYQEKASQLNQTLEKAAENAEDLLMIINSVKECDDEIDLACVVLSNLIVTIEKELLDEEAVRKSILERILSLQAFLKKKSSGGNAVKDLEIKIKDFALSARYDIQTLLNNFELAKDDREFLEFFQEFHQTMRKVAESTAELLKIIINSRSNEVDEPSEIQPLNSWLKHASKLANVESNGSSQRFLKLKERLVGRDQDCRKIKNLLFSSHYELQKSYLPYHSLSSKSSGGVAISESGVNYVRKRLQEKTSQLNQTLQEAAEKVESNGSSQLFLKLEDRKVGPHRGSELTIISIVGMVGIGKTALARTIYEDPSVALHFKVRGWITIPQDYNKSQMLSDLLQSITPAEPNIIEKGSTPDKLEMQVLKCLFGRRYLIVLDNILSNQAWNDIRQCFPNDTSGSCILLTTSHYKQEYYHRNYVHHMTLLDPKEGWDLFCNILPIKEHMAPEFEKIRNHVVEKCDGLPQLIIEVAKRLSKCNNIQEGWKKIEKELESLGILDRNALTVSYNLLPHHLKVCFLYFGVFPKRKSILVEML